MGRQRISQPQTQSPASLPEEWGRPGSFFIVYHRSHLLLFMLISFTATPLSYFF
jgi:hypothetical protein